MIRFSHLLRACVAVAAFGAAACSTPIANGPDQTFDVDKRFPISVQARMMALRLPYNGQTALDDNASGQIARFARDYLAYGSGSIAVVPPDGNQAVSNLVINELIDNGVSRGQIMVGTNAPGPADDIRLTYIRYVAETQPCGDWSSNLSYTANNVAHPNFGCATQHNVAAMVADPRDLLTPDTSGQPDAQRRLTVLDKYRAGQVTTAAKSSEQTINLSGIGGM